MGIQVDPQITQWNYFLALESDLEELSRYVEFTEDNFSAYSLQMARLLLTASSEVDVVAKMLCEIIGKTPRRENINEYRKNIKPTFKEIPDFKVSVPRYGLTSHPWENWKKDTIPVWWEGHNKVKHNRNAHLMPGTVFGEPSNGSRFLVESGITIGGRSYYAAPALIYFIMKRGNAPRCQFSRCEKYSPFRQFLLEEMYRGQVRVFSHQEKLPKGDLR